MQGQVIKWSAIVASVSLGVALVAALICVAAYIGIVAITLFGGPFATFMLCAWLLVNVIPIAAGAAGLFVLAWLTAFAAVFVDFG